MGKQGGGGGSIVLGFAGNANGSEGGKEGAGGEMGFSREAFSQHQIRGRIRSEADFQEVVRRRPIEENARNITHDGRRQRVMIKCMESIQDRSDRATIRRGEEPKSLTSLGERSHLEKRLGREG